MFDLKELMNNETVKGIMEKVGVSEEQASSVLNTAAKTMKSKFSGNETQASSLLSQNENTAEDNKLAEEVEEGFLSKLSADDNGIDDGIISKLKGAAMPAIMSVMASKFSGSSESGASGITSMLSGFVDDKDGDGIGMNDVMDTVKGKLGGLFGK
ncbi:MAG: hypothetical protein ACPGU5_01695 [Lishizhenia sp.]